VSFDGYLSLGDIEILNAQRTTAYVDALIPEFPLVRRTSDYDTIAEALGDGPYTNPAADGAVWVSPDDESTEDFYGLYPLEIQGIPDSTLEADVTESILDGGFVNAQRATTRSIRVRGLLIAKTDLALEGGLTWLRNALRVRDSEGFLGPYEAYSLRYFLAPPPADPLELYPYERWFHRTKTTTGVSVIRKLELTCDAAAYEVDFVLVAQNPHAYASPVEVAEPLDGPVTVEDYALVNLIPQCSFEEAGSQVALPWTNLVTNPRPASTTGFTTILQGGTAALSVVDNGYTPELHETWSAANTSAGAGVYRDVTVVAGNVYSFMIRSVRRGDAGFRIGIKLDIEWRTAGATISTSAGTGTIIGGGIEKTLTRENLTAPALAVIARMRLISVSVVPYGHTFSIGHVLVSSGWMAVLSKAIPVYFDGSTDDEFFDGTWTGTADASTSTVVGQAVEDAVTASGTGVTAVVRGPNDKVPEGWPYNDDFDGLGGTPGYPALSPYVNDLNQGPGLLFAVWTSAPSDDNDILLASPGDGENRAQVSPAQEYTARMRVKHGGAALQRFRLDIRCYDTDGATLSVVTGTEAVSSSGVLTLDNTFTTPADCRYVDLELYSTDGTSYHRWTAGEWYAVDAAILNPGATSDDYLDGDSLDNSTYDFQWYGDTFDSPSFAVPADNTAVLIDPDLPALPSPPSPPSITTEALDFVPIWDRYSIEIPAANVPLWAGAAPIVALAADTDPLRQVRVRFYPNPTNIAPGSLTDGYESEFLLSYLPADTVLTTDYVSQIVYASVSGSEEIQADQLLYGAAGGPMEWGELTGGVDYTMTIDITPGTSVANLDVTLSLSRRE
jgi:hypothetical protein